jgi:hypothetical protein
MDLSAVWREEFYSCKHTTETNTSFMKVLVITFRENLGKEKNEEVHIIKTIAVFRSYSGLT